ncbi:hypothetical protein [Mycobacteroides chelonae]|uniref:hypothetical protein n=1 Tax=Mycobacteroides chelonae TaxID=1774 RepID=UPI0018E37F7A|nr:hypothetical protein [Mycobacteroides chelonae]
MSRSPERIPYRWGDIENDTAGLRFIGQLHAMPWRIGQPHGIGVYDDESTITPVPSWRIHRWSHV